GQVAGVAILRPVDRREGIQYLDEIVIEGGVWRTSADGAFPGVPVGVDEARDDHITGHIDHPSIRLDVRRDLRDLVALDQHIALQQIADLRIHRDHRTAAKQQSVSHVVLLLGTQRWWKASTWRRTAAESN